jgi:nucleoside-diphosphate-sugar epimerase
MKVLVTGGAGFIRSPHILDSLLEHGMDGVIWGHPTSINALARKPKELTNTHSHLVRGPAQPADIRRIWLDADKARRELGWAPKVGLEESLRKSAEYQRAVQAAVS